MLIQHFYPVAAYNIIEKGYAHFTRLPRCNTLNMKVSFFPITLHGGYMNPKKVALTSLTCMVVILMFAVVAVAQYQATAKAGDYDVAMTIDRNPPVVGQNIVTIAVKDDNGKPVTDASVRLEFGMAAMPGMPAIDYKSNAAPIYEVYKAPMTISIAGPWYIHVKILRDNKISTAEFNVDVQ